MLKIMLLSAFVGIALADVSHIVDDTTSTTYPPRPYQFSYVAGRAPGHTDRSHAEVGDGSGTVRGAFSYVDPKNEVRTVEYVADEHGFYPRLSHPVENTKSVDLATKRHFALYNKIAENHADPNYAVYAPQPVDSDANTYAKEKHLYLFDKIAAEHARLGEEQLAQRLAFEATSIKNDEEEFSSPTARPYVARPLSIEYAPQHTHVKNSEAVDLATKRHFALYNKIAERNADPNFTANQAAPKDSAAVAYAKDKHLSLFEKIAAEHARLGEEQLAQRLAFEATSIRNEEADSSYHQ